MRLGEPVRNKTKQWVNGFLIALALLFLFAFRGEIWDFLKLFGLFFEIFVLGFPFDGVDLSILESFNKLFINCLFGFGLLFIFWVFLISAQALLPTSNAREIYRTAWHLWLFITRRHGPAVFIKDGQEISTKEDKEHRGHGVIVVDFNSAVVLEERGVPPGLSSLANSTGLNLLSLLSLSDSPESPRVCGPGIVFTRPGERIRGVVDLRRQFRIQPKVQCYTREGIELSANVFAIFTIGQDPEGDALQVTYQGERRPENLRVCVFQPVTSGPASGGLKLTALNDELDSDDCQEINHFARIVRRTGGLYAYAPLPSPQTLPVFNRERVFSAVFAQARNGQQDAMPWTELPTRVAASFFRELMPQINYDQLYELKENTHYPLPGYKRKLANRMRNNGILAYRLVFHQTGEPLILGETYQPADLVVTEIQKLTTSKLLRDRGIKVIMSSFGDPSPVSSIIYKQRLDNWRANWERELDITQAGRSLQAMRIRSHALAEAQQDLWYSLNQLFQVQDCSDEALALQLMQALEVAASDPTTRQLLPGQTIDMLRQIHLMLKPEPQPPSASPNVLNVLKGPD